MTDIKALFYRVYQAYEARIPHVEGVVELAVALAKRQAVDHRQMAAAAYLHDLTKYESDDWHVAFFHEKNHPEYADIAPFMYHGYSASLIGQDFPINPRFLDAVKHHTTGRPQMTQEEKILMLADKVEKNRPFKEAQQIREKSLVQFDEAFIDMLDHLYVFDQMENRLTEYNLATYKYYFPERTFE